MPGLKQTVVQTLHRYLPKLWMERELRARPNHFEPELWLIPMLVDKSRVALDIGANTGTYSYYMSKFAGQVISFEPNCDLWPRLRQLIGKGLRIEPFALSTHSGTATFRVDHTNTGVATIEEKNDLSCVSNPSAVETRTVEIRTLDSFQLTNVSLIKIDTEGHEESVLAGGRETLLQNRPAIIVESENRHNPGAPRRVAQFLTELGFHGFYLKDSKLQPFESLSDSDLDASHLSSGAYVNNFLFLPSEQAATRERIESFVASSKH